MDHLRVATGSPICRIPSGVLRLGSTQHPRDATRERCADDGSPSGDQECAASGPSIMYAGDRGRTEGSELEPSAPLFGARAGSRRVPSGTRRDFRRHRAPSGARNDAVDFPLGVDLLASHRTFGAHVGMRPRCRSFGNAHRSRTRPVSVLPSGQDREERSAPAFGLEATVAGEPSTFGPTASTGRRSQTRPRLLAFLRLFGSGTPKRVGTARRNVQHGNVWAARQRGSIGIVSIQSPWEHRAVRSRKATWPQRTPRWNKALRSTG